MFVTDIKVLLISQFHQVVCFTFLTVSDLILIYLACVYH